MKAAHQMCDVLNEPPTTFLRVNVARVPRDKVFSFLTARSVPVEKTLTSKVGLLMATKHKMLDLPEYKLGYFEIQDCGCLGARVCVGGLGAMPAVFSRGSTRGFVCRRLASNGFPCGAPLDDPICCFEFEVAIRICSYLGRAKIFNTSSDATPRRACRFPAESVQGVVALLRACGSWPGCRPEWVQPARHNASDCHGLGARLLIWAPRP